MSSQMSEEDQKANESHCQWFYDIQERVIDPSRELATPDQWLDAVKVIKKDVRSVFEGYSKETHQYLIAATTWWHFFVRSGVNIHDKPAFISRPRYISLDTLPPQLRDLQDTNSFEVPKNPVRAHAVAPPPYEVAEVDTPFPVYTGKKYGIAQHFAADPNAGRPSHDRQVVTTSASTEAPTPGSLSLGQAGRLAQKQSAIPSAGLVVAQYLDPVLKPSQKDIKDETARKKAERQKAEDAVRNNDFSSISREEAHRIMLTPIPPSDWANETEEDDTDLSDSSQGRNIYDEETGQYYDHKEYQKLLEGRLEKKMQEIVEKSMEALKKQLQEQIESQKANATKLQLTDEPLEDHILKSMPPKEAEQLAIRVLRQSKLQAEQEQLKTEQERTKTKEEKKKNKHQLKRERRREKNAKAADKDNSDVAQDAEASLDVSADSAVASSVDPTVTSSDVPAADPAANSSGDGEDGDV
ncbi:uncharacterized protein EAE98_005416 [Botrytis deweyae]|uniref:Uncharacterized protein n=1 Tax=Botrytis deweyae TaxID=2478750 RepID=A0ABQ7INT5_9HELO|nr:uncharacterized protein EAE98_005416 [Botrytis deweyae]KAF7929498.1 hypothetical protein EAE98_005416 [Botrytis deweyae]